MEEINSLIYIVDDEEGIRRSVARALTSLGYRTAVFAGSRETLDQFRREPADLLIVDLRLPDMDGLQLMKAIQALSGQPEFIIITGHGTVESAVDAMKQGAYDFIQKPFDPFTLRKTVRKALERHRLVTENLTLRRMLDQETGNFIVGHNSRMRALMELVQQVAPTSATVLIQGESGTGKGMVAQTIHDQSLRRDRPFVKINCGALPESLLESELFGHEKGAFTDAFAAHPGKFEQAAGGTLFLDEVGEMSPAMQVKLLRVLQEREFERVGGTRTYRADVRIVAATNTDIESHVRAGRFREDLFYRLNVINITLPPLRVRQEDIPLLANYFLRQYAIKNDKQIDGFSPDALALFQHYPWPGNIRELQNVIERSVILTITTTIEVTDLPERVRTPHEFPPAGGDQGSIPIPFGTPLGEVEPLYVTEVVRRLNGNKPLAAELLGVTLRTVYRRLE